MTLTYCTGGKGTYGFAFALLAVKVAPLTDSSAHRLTYLPFPHIVVFVNGIWCNTCISNTSCEGTVQGKYPDSTRGNISISLFHAVVFNTHIYPLMP
jgi:hypothetical protein